MKTETYLKKKKLETYLKDLDKIAIAYSSGVDSTFLLKIAHDILKDNVIAITVSTNTFPKREFQESIQFCQLEAIKQIIIPFDVLSINGFKENPKDRCYICKKELFKNIKQIAEINRINHVCEGSNIDDLKDYRPGLKAIKELNVKSPLCEVGLNKNEIRELSKELNLITWNKPSFACLASRFAYGETITEEKLSMIDKAEQLLLSYGFTQFRVRIHGSNMARIEVLPQEFEKLLDIRNTIISKFQEYGFIYVSMDLVGYRTGSMNVF